MLTLYDELRIEGIMPERALLRLKRAGIPLYEVRKIQKNAILLRVRRKDRRKVFAIYPNLCYNEGTTAPYKATYLGGVGLAKIVDFCKNRVGLLLGGLAFCILTLAADTFLFGVDFVGTSVYARETMQVLEEYGVRLFAPYKKGKEKQIAAKLLSLDFVEFCTVQKVGNRLRVELRISPFVEPILESGQMQAKHTGEIIALTVLRGSALKKTGDTVTLGEAIVGDWFSTLDGGQVRVEPIARVRISCVYEGVSVVARTEEEAFAESYLALRLGDKDEIVGQEITQTEDGFSVKIHYIVTESINL